LKYTFIKASFINKLYCVIPSDTNIELEEKHVKIEKVEA